jgi:uncharacterized protein YyaL (SSP411 family)
MVLSWSRQFDNIEGGMNKAPKFPMPNNYSFLLRYAKKFDSEKVSKHAHLTLQKMALGGIYDQIGGGFARYSVDMIWKVPHFEKMLYDNGQLLRLYSLAYKRTKNKFYKEVIDQIIEFLNKELLAENGLYYASIDADSEGTEGLYYIWTFDELNKIYSCPIGSDGFCGKSEEIFKFYKTSEWRNFNLEQVFNKMIDNSWEFFIKTYGIGYIGK